MTSHQHFVASSVTIYHRIVLMEQQRKRNETAINCHNLEVNLGEFSCRFKTSAMLLVSYCDPRKTLDRCGQIQIGCCRQIHHLTANQAFKMSTSVRGFTRIAILHPREDWCRRGHSMTTSAVTKRCGIFPALKCPRRRLP